jgi:8-oxo-dGTP pyrophosphatase MutT (NUDIX family)
VPDAGGPGPARKPDEAAGEPPGPHGKEYTVIVAVRNGHGGKQFLMVNHRDRGWELPGGKLEPNEGPVHCALREFREETGHLLAQPHFVAKLKKPNGTCYIFTGTLGAEVENDAEDAIDGMEWFDRLPRDQRLAFPDDLYEEMGKLLEIQFG